MLWVLRPVVAGICFFCIFYCVQYQSAPTSATGKEAMNMCEVDCLPCGTEMRRKKSRVVGKR